MSNVQLINISKAYGPHDVFKEFYLDVHTGEFVCILGPSGCGKSTLLNILSGLDTSFTGDVRLSASPTSEPARIGYVFQEPRLLPWLPVVRNITFVLKGLMPRPKAKAHALNWLARIGLANYHQHYPNQLSIGMQQRLSVARALAIEPSVLLMDEPFSALDELTALNMRSELLELWRDLTPTVLFVTHNPLEAAFLADRVIVMNASGQIAFDERVAIARPRAWDTPELWHYSRQLVHALG